MMKAPLVLVLLLVAAEYIRADLFTALVDLENLLHAERHVAVHLRQFVDEQTRHLRQLTMYVLFTID